jgi:hypothetical protein
MGRTELLGGPKELFKAPASVVESSFHYKSKLFLSKFERYFDRLVRRRYDFWVMKTNLLY